MTDTYKTKNITVRQKIATGDDTYIVCGNSDYTVHWDLDNEWAEYAEKTMLVVLDSGEVYSIQFTGTEAALPALPNTRRCVIGLMAGDVRTTTGAMFACRPSIRDASGTPVEPPADLYAQLTAQLAGKISEPSQDGTAGQALVTDGKGGRSWATVQGGGSADAILYTEQELTDEQQAQARANIDAISSADVPAKLPNPQPLEIIYADAAEANYPGRVTYDGSSPQSIDIRSNFTEWRSTMPGYIKNNPFAESGKTYLPTGANWTNEFSQSSTLNFEIDGTKYYNVEGVQGSPMYMLTFTCGDYTIKLNRMNTTFRISPTTDEWYLVKIGALPQINMEADPESDMQIATKKYVDNHAAASGKDGITPTIGENGNWYLGDEDTGKPSRGAAGVKGDTGPQGPAGKDGAAINWRGEWQDGTLYSKLDAVSYEGSGYIFTSDTSATGAVPGIDVEWQLMAQGGAGGPDISLGLTGATIGQIAKISAVDDNGVPTAWEPVDMPSGGSRNPSIGELLLSAEASDVASFSQNFDTKNYTKFVFFIGGTKAESTISIQNGIFYLDGIEYHICYYTGWLQATVTAYPNGSITETFEKITSDMGKVSYSQCVSNFDEVKTNFQGNASINSAPKTSYLKGSVTTKSNGLELRFSQAVQTVKVLVYGYN